MTKNHAVASGSVWAQKQRLGVVALICGMGVGFSAGGCAPAADGSPDESTGIGGTDEALQLGPGSPAIFRWAGRMTGSAGVEFDHSLDPAVCSVEDLSIALVSRDADTLRYRVFGMNRQTLAPSWTQYGNRTFGTRPACVSYDWFLPTPTFVIAGRGLSSNGASDRRVFTSLARWNVQPFSGPEPATVWTAVSADTYQTNGSPGLAFDGWKMVIALLGDDSRLYAHQQWAPYEGNDFSPRIQGPALPTGWTAQGTPAISALFHGPAAFFQIIVRARNMNNVNRLYTTYFSVDRFTNWAGATPATWTQVSTGGYTVSSDPAFAWDWSIQNATLYFRSGSDIIQTSGVGPQLGTLPISPIVEFQGNGLTLVGSPGAQGGSGVDHGRNLVVARSSTDNQLYACESETGVIP